MGQILKLKSTYQVKQVGEESDRTLRFIGTNETPDRDGDIIMADGWKLDNFLKNPVFLGFHNYYSVPLGKCVNISRQDQSLTFDIKFASIEELSSNPDLPSDEAQDADTVYMAYKNGYLNAVSVGFIGLDSDERDDQDDLPSWQRGRIFTSQELLELSAVAIPSNPTALQQARSAKSLDQNKIQRLEKFFASHKGAISYKKYPLADEDLGWNAGDLVKSADTDDLKIMCTWFDSDNADVKGSYKLPHHLGSDDGYKTVWHGVAAAMGALLGAQGGVNIPDVDRKAVFDHLGKHYKEFEKDVPEFKNYTISEWKSFCDKEKKDMKPDEVKAAIQAAIAPLQDQIKLLKLTKSGAKHSADTIEKMQACVDHLAKGYESINAAQTVLKTMMQGDDSEPDGQAPGEMNPAVDDNGNVDQTTDGDADIAAGKKVDLSKIDIKKIPDFKTKTIGGQK